MKIRKGILAAATAATVSLTGVVAAPAFAETTPTSTSSTSSTSSSSTTTTTTTPPKTTESKKREPSQTTRDMFYEYNKDTQQYYISPSKIISWIGVFTTALAAVGTFIGFLDKNFNIKF